MKIQPTTIRVRCMVRYIIFFTAAVAKKGFFLFALLCVACGATVYGQQDVRFEHLTVDDGLSQSAITAMIQDKHGYLWITTLDGLNRYDGSNFKVYRNDQSNPRSLPTNTLSQIFLDKHQNLWVSYVNGLSRYDDLQDTFRNFTVDADHGQGMLIRDFDQYSDTSIVLSTNHGFLEFNPISGTYKKAAGTLSQFDGKNIFAFFNSKTLGTWVVLDREIRRLSGDSSRLGTWSTMFSHTHMLTAFYDRKNERVYIQTPDALYKYNSKTGEFEMIVHFESEAEPWMSATSMCRISSGELWVSRGEIHVLDTVDHPKKILEHVEQDPNSLSSNYATSIYETRDNVVWVGTNGVGLNKYNPARSVFGYLAAFPGAPLTLSNNFITTVFSPSDRITLVGTLAGLDIVDRSLNRSKHFDIFGKDGKRAQVFKILDEHKGRYVLCTNKGLLLLRNNRIELPDLETLANPQLVVYDAIRVSNGKYVLATSQGVLLWGTAPTSLKTVHPHGSVVVERINDAIWIESAGNITLLDTASFEVREYFPQQAASSKNVPPKSLKCIVQDRTGTIWIGSWGGGITHYNPSTKTFTNYREDAGLPNAVVYGILEDTVGLLWLSTNKGLCVFDPVIKRSIKNFAKVDGLQGDEFNTHAYYKSPSGTLYFGGTNGLTYFDPRQALAIPASIPKSVITGVYINSTRSERLNLASIGGDPASRQTMELQSNERNFGFDIAGLGFTFPSGTRVKYKLENFDLEWKFNGREKRISFTNIPPGKYVLYIKSANAFGEWEEPGLAVDIVVHGPIWQSPWFLYGAILSLFACGYLFYAQRTKILKNRSKILQSQVDQRTEEILRQQKEIAEQNEELMAQSEMLEIRNVELERVKEFLERQVERRTADLQQANENLVDQNTQLEQFTFITAHNIRGPLASIKGLVNILNPTHDREVTQYLINSVNKLDEVIADLNSILSIRHGIDPLQEIVHLKEQLLLAVELLQEQFRAIDATIDVTQISDISIRGSRPYVQSIFYNLIHNALKYHNPRKQTLIRCRIWQENDLAIITVEDNGIGIDMRYAHEKIFKLYQRFHPTINGKGFGLFLVRTQIVAMGGNISVDSQLDRGTKFTIQFPAIPNY